MQILSRRTGSAQDNVNMVQPFCKEEGVHAVIVVQENDCIFGAFLEGSIDVWSVVKSTAEGLHGAKLFVGPSSRGQEKTRKKPRMH